MRRIAIVFVLSTTLLSQLCSAGDVLKTSLCEGLGKLTDPPLFGEITHFVDDSDVPRMTFERKAPGTFKKSYIGRTTKAVSCQIEKEDGSGTYNILEIYDPPMKGFLLVFLDYYTEPAGTVFLTNVFTFDRDMLNSYGISYKIKKDYYGEYIVVDRKTAKQPRDLIKSISTSGQGRYSIRAEQQK